MRMLRKLLLMLHERNNLNSMAYLMSALRFFMSLGSWRWLRAFYFLVGLGFAS